LAARSIAGHFGIRATSRSTFLKELLDQFSLVSTSECAGIGIAEAGEKNQAVSQVHHLSFSIRDVLCCVVVIYDKQQHNKASLKPGIFALNPAELSI
jgi:hypothetical protein